MLDTFIVSGFIMCGKIVPEVLNGNYVHVLKVDPKTKPTQTKNCRLTVSHGKVYPISY